NLAAAREIARELGGFTLAVESVAIYLGLHPDIRPADYLTRLRAEGLTGVDALPADAGVAAQMQHREKQLRLVLDQTLEKLSPAERTALDYAALLPPESIPWPWLRALVEQEHPDAFATAPGHPDPWPALRRRLEGLRLLTPGDHVNVARLHRMVAAHLRERLDTHASPAGANPPRAGGAGSEGQRPGPMPAQGSALGSASPRAPSPEGAAQNAHVPPLQGLGEPGAAVPGALPQAGMARPFGAERLRLLRDKVEAFALALQYDIEHDPAAHLWQVAPMQEAVRHWQHGEQDTALGHIAGVVGGIEATLGRLDVALHFLSIYHETAERLLRANPESAQAARDVSVSLNKLADFLARRGLPGDAEAALGHYQRSLEVLERLLRANPESAQAARDVMVSLERLAAFEAGRSGGEAKALELQSRALGIALKLREGNPQSLFCGRTAAVSFFLTFQRAQAAGNEKLARQCLAGCFSVLDPMVTAGVGLDAPMRQLHAQLAPMFHRDA
ncbi:MAG TPA: hypothetical protein PLP58_21790, partial [Prosthecobacter sp.]|nr:hypothetical protein [Prosthecobacter sp.]